MAYIPVAQYNLKVYTHILYVSFYQGQFTDDNFDEFIGSWIEGGILHKITISLEDIREIA